MWLYTCQIEMELETIVRLNDTENCCFTIYGHGVEMCNTRRKNIEHKMCHGGT